MKIAVIILILFFNRGYSALSESEEMIKVRVPVPPHWILKEHSFIVTKRTKGVIMNALSAPSGPTRDDILIGFVRRNKKTLSVRDMVRITRAAWSTGGQRDILMPYVRVNRKKLSYNDLRLLSYAADERGVREDVLRINTCMGWLTSWI